MQIYPSILELTASQFEAKMSLVLPYFNHVQIDITDGIFVPQKTVQIEEIERSIVEKPSFAKASEGNTFEFHLMVVDYKKEIEKLEKLKEKMKITSVLVHASALALDPSTTLEMTKKESVRWEYGIVLNPEDSVNDNWELIKQLETVQLMTVHPGQQGSAFVPEALGKITELRELGFTGKIILDGAMNDKTLEVVLRQKYLPDAICPGSYFSQDVEERLNKLNSLLAK